jgi:AraC-like DNA-binding protein
VRETVDSGEHETRVCSVVVKPPGVVHRNQYGPDRSRSLVIEFDAAALRAHPRLLRAFASFRVHRALPVAMAALRVRQAFGESDPTNPHHLRTAVDELLGTLTIAQPQPSSSGDGTSWIDAARQEITRELALATPFRDIAERLGVHPVSLCRAFRRRYGCTMREYVARLRLFDAADRLARSDEPLAHVAVETGFSDQSHLTRVFRRGFGVPPARFRRLTHPDHGVMG